MKETKILLIGLGYWGQIWYKTLLKSKYKFAVVEPKLKSGVDAHIQVFHSLDNVNLNEFTHAIVVTPAETHVKMVEQLGEVLPASNILVEKPCGTHYLDAPKLGMCYPGYLQLHSPAFSYIHHHLKDIGTPHLYKSIRASMGPKLRRDCSIVEDYLIHDLYLFVALFEPSNNIQIVSRNSMRRLSTHGPDTIFLHLYNPDVHVLGDMFSSWWYPIKERRVIIMGDRGSFVWINDELSFFDSRYEINTKGTDAFGNWGDHLVQGLERKIDLGAETAVECELENFVSGDFSGSWRFIQPTWNLIRDIHFHTRYRY